MRLPKPGLSFADRLDASWGHAQRILVMEGRSKVSAEFKIFLKSRSVRRVVLPALIIVLAYPLFDKMFIYPRFRSLIIEEVKNDSILVASHIKGMTGLDTLDLSGPTLSDEHALHFNMIKGDFKLNKLKVFSPSGVVIYSTDPGDLGSTTDKRYFNEVIAKGKTYTKVVRKDSRTLERRVVSSDVVETYVPIMRDNKFAGALELYFDISDRLRDLDTLLFRLSALLFVMTFGLTGGILVTSFKVAKAEDRLRKLSRAVEQSPSTVMIADSKGNVEYVNPRFTQLTGYRAEEVIGEKPWTLKSDGHSSAVYEKLAETFAGGEGYKGEFQSRRNGKVCWELASISPIKDSKGAVTHFLIMEEDITEQKRAEEALRESEERYRTLYKNTPAMLHSIDKGGRIVSVSEYWLSVLGYDFEEVLGRKLTDFMTEDSRRHAEEVALPAFFESGCCRDVAYQLVKKNGEVLDVLVSAISERGPDGGVGRSLAVLFDLTERKKAEERLLRAHDELQKAYESLERAQSTAIASEKLAALGRLTAGVSHEILNPLNIITLRLYMLINGADVSPKVLSDLKTLEEQAYRIAKIAQDLLSFSRQRPPEPLKLDLNEIAKRTVELVSHDLPLQNIAIEMELAEGLPLVLADQGQLQQVVLNLVTNAMDVMQDGGKLTLRTQAASGKGREFVELRVEDTGSGIPPENIDKLFDPFFTTKPEGEGTGLGLSICQGIVEAHGGSIRAENVSGGGAAFIVRLEA